jgi:chaperone modulatory protein CbpM
MIMHFEAVVALFPDLEPDELTAWIEHRWIEPEHAPPDTLVFHEIDIARVRMIYDLRRTFDVGEEIVPVILSLLDQIYELRSNLKALTRAVDALPPEMRSSVMAAVKNTL